MDLMKPSEFNSYLIKIGAKQAERKVIKPNVAPELIESARKLLGDISDTFEASKTSPQRKRKLHLTRLLKQIERG